jgi:ATP-binding cassette subfamily A (ABC1) protein 3
VARLTNIIKKTIPEAEIKSDMGSVLCYMLPSEQTKQFPDLFELLERDKQMLGISSIGVSITTLEEVFLR